jgi:hypothetical protein
LFLQKNNYLLMTMILSGTRNFWLLVAVGVGSSHAFAPTQRATLARATTLKPIKAATLEPITTSTNGEAAPTTWDCDEEAECVEVPACDEEVCRTSLDVRIHGDWYDLTG